VAFLTGCVQQGLYARVNDATIRVLEANGYTVVDVPSQGCCGALHAHGGALDQARALARANVEAFGPADVDWVVVNAAGCGAAMKAYEELLGEGSAEALSAKVRDLAELLASGEIRRGAPVPCTVAVDHPCHLVHAQGIRQEPVAMLEAVPGAEIREVERADECCGGAGIYGITHPELGGRIGGDKVAAVERCAADVLATPNPGCMMQIGAGLLLEGSRTGVVHPVEILDESYRRAGFYEEDHR
jgi:glycolate oxidase iron-sulfur subunit